MLKQTLRAFALLIATACVADSEIRSNAVSKDVPLLKMTLESRGDDEQRNQVFQVTIQNLNPGPVCVVNPHVSLLFRRLEDKATIIGYTVKGTENLELDTLPNLPTDALGDYVLPAGFEHKFEVTIVPNHKEADGKLNVLKNPNEPGLPLKTGDRLAIYLFIEVIECLKPGAAATYEGRPGEFIVSAPARYTN